MYGLEYAITYFYNVYGKREISNGKYATLIALFTEKYKNNQPLTVVNPGTQVRNFTHVDDIVNGVILVGEHGLGDGYGIGTNVSFSILEIAEMFGGKIIMVPERPGNRIFGDLHVEKTKKLNWKPKHSVSDYIKNIIKNKSKE